MITARRAARDDAAGPTAPLAPVHHPTPLPRGRWRWWRLAHTQTWVDRGLVGCQAILVALWLGLLVLAWQAAAAPGTTVSPTALTWGGAEPRLRWLPPRVEGMTLAALRVQTLDWTCTPVIWTPNGTSALTPPFHVEAVNEGLVIWNASWPAELEAGWLMCAEGPLTRGVGFSRAAVRAPHDAGPDPVVLAVQVTQCAPQLGLAAQVPERLRAAEGWWLNPQQRLWWGRSLDGWALPHTLALGDPLAWPEHLTWTWLPRGSLGDVPLQFRLSLTDPRERNLSQVASIQQRLARWGCDCNATFTPACASTPPPPAPAPAPAPPFAWDWSASTGAWWAVTGWQLIVSTYSTGLVKGVWTHFPRLAVVSQAFLLALHMPLREHLSFTWYVGATVLGLVTPALYLSYRATRVWWREPRKVRLPDDDLLRGVGHYVIFLCLYLLVLGMTLTLRR